MTRSDEEDQIDADCRKRDQAGTYSVKICARHPDIGNASAATRCGHGGTSTRRRRHHSVLRSRLKPARGGFVWALVVPMPAGSGGVSAPVAPAPRRRTAREMRDSAALLVDCAKEASGVPWFRVHPPSWGLGSRAPSSTRVWGGYSARGCQPLSGSTPRLGWVGLDLPPWRDEFSRAWSAMRPSQSPHRASHLAV